MLDIYFREDIRNALLAADESNSAAMAMAVQTGADPHLLRAYRAGYRAAMATLALAFGLRSEGDNRALDAKP